MVEVISVVGVEVNVGVEIVVVGVEIVHGVVVESGVEIVVETGVICNSDAGVGIIEVGAVEIITVGQGDEVDVFVVVGGVADVVVCKGVVVEKVTIVVLKVIAMGGEKVGVK